MRFGILQIVFDGQVMQFARKGDAPSNAFPPTTVLAPMPDGPR